jgi:hypothetical protein
VQVGRDDRLPLLEGEVLHGNRWRADAGVVEEHVQPPVPLTDLGEQTGHFGGFPDIGRHRDAPRTVGTGGRERLFERLGPTASERDAVSRSGERQGHGASDTRARARHDGYLLNLDHAAFPTRDVILTSRQVGVTTQPSHPPRDFQRISRNPPPQFPGTPLALSRTALSEDLTT